MPVARVSRGGGGVGRIVGPLEADEAILRILIRRRLLGDMREGVEVVPRAVVVIEVERDYVGIGPRIAIDEVIANAGDCTPDDSFASKNLMPFGL